MSDTPNRLNVTDTKAKTPDRVFQSVQADIGLYRDSLSILAGFFAPLERVVSQTLANELTFLKVIDSPGEDPQEGH